MAAAFLIACLTLTNTGPISAYLTMLQREINTNEMSIGSTYEPAYVYLWLLSTPTAYTVHCNVPYQISVNPGLISDISNHATGPQITESDRQHLVLCHVYNTYHLDNKTLRALVLAAIPNIFL